MSHQCIFWGTAPESPCAICNRVYAEYELTAIAEAVDVMR